MSKENGPDLLRGPTGAGVDSTDSDEFAVVGINVDSIALRYKSIRIA
jgi:hypothetical protein